MMDCGSTIDYLPSDANFDRQRIPFLSQLSCNYCNPSKSDPNTLMVGVDHNEETMVLKNYHEQNSVLLTTETNCSFDDTCFDTRCDDVCREKERMIEDTNDCERTTILIDCCDIQQEGLTINLEALTFDESDWSDMIDELNWERWYHSMMMFIQHRVPLSDENFIHKDGLTTIIHVAAWKAPKTLMLLLLDIMANNSYTDLSCKSPEHRIKRYLLCADNHGNTPLHMACGNLHLSLSCSDELTIDFSIVKNLLLLGQEAMEIQNVFGDTPFHLLLASDAFNQRNNFSEKTEKEAVEAVTSICCMSTRIVSCRNDNGLTPLHIAIANHCPKGVLIQLLRATPNAVTTLDKYGMSPLHFVASYGATSWVFVRELVTMAPEMVHQQTVNGDTPLHLFVANARQDFDQKKLKLLAILVGNNDSFYQPLLIQNIDGYTPLHCCAKINAPNAITQRLMKSPVAQLASTIISGIDDTPLHIALLTLNDEGNRYDAIGLPNALANVAALATIDACRMFDANDLTPLMRAAKSKKWSTILVKIFLAADAEIAAQQSSQGSLALHFACKNRKVQISTVKALISAYPAGLATVTKQQNTPLHIAAKSGKKSLIKLLIKNYPMAVEQRNKKGELPNDRVLAGNYHKLKELFDKSF